MSKYHIPGSQKGENKHKKDFWVTAIAVEQTIVNSVNAGQKPGHNKQRMPNSEPSAILELLIWKLSQNHHSV